MNNNYKPVNHISQLPIIGLANVATQGGQVILNEISMKIRVKANTPLGKVAWISSISHRVAYRCKGNAQQWQTTPCQNRQQSSNAVSNDNNS